MPQIGADSAAGVGLPDRQVIGSAFVEKQRDEGAQGLALTEAVEVGDMGSVLCKAARFAISPAGLGERWPADLRPHRCPSGVKSHFR
ncbi:hypothetical protein RKD20_001323 [Streptomyces sp. SLBN-8D4]